MCKDCGCGRPPAGRRNGAAASAHRHGEHGDAHEHAHGAHVHSHAHGGADHTHQEAEVVALRLERSILSRNDAAAAQNRAWLAQRGVVAINLISSPGSGKTTLLERTLDALRGDAVCAVITGDQQTDRDAQRLQGRGALVRQIETQNACHLDAERVGRLLPEVAADGAKLLFIENVGNLVCPAAFDLGENFKVALLSTAEGEDKPLKYPTLFAEAPVIVLTKMDLAPHLDWSLARCREYINLVHPGAFVFELSAKTGQGMDAWLAYLRRQAGG